MKKKKKIIPNRKGQHFVAGDVRQNIGLNQGAAAEGNAVPQSRESAAAISSTPVL